MNNSWRCSGISQKSCQHGALLSAAETFITHRLIFLLLSLAFLLPYPASWDHLPNELPALKFCLTLLWGKPKTGVVSAVYVNGMWIHQEQGTVSRVQPDKVQTRKCPPGCRILWKRRAVSEWLWDLRQTFMFLPPWPPFFHSLSLCNRVSVCLLPWVLPVIILTAQTVHLKDEQRGWRDVSHANCQ